MRVTASGKVKKISMLWLIEVEKTSVFLKLLSQERVWHFWERKYIGKMNILSECKTMLAYAGLNKGQFVNIAGLNIHRTTIRICIILLLLSAILTEGSVCVKGFRHHSGDTVLLPLHLGLSCLAALFIYIRLMMKTEQIDQLISYLDDLVKKRNDFWFW